ncbi:hypothetical protein PENTCL1PPCAC_13929, partial [Pristionchus entomophagus]
SHHSLMQLLTFILLYSSFISVQPWVIYRKEKKQGMMQQVDKHVASSNAPLYEMSKARSERMIEPQFKESFKFVGEGTSNTTWYVDGKDFDIVSQELSKEEITEVRKIIIGMCINLLSTKP